MINNKMINKSNVEKSELGINPSMSDSEEQILNPNCSEMVFRIRGDFKEIKTQVFNMIEWIEMEFDGRVGDGPREKLSACDTARFKEVREQVKKCKTLEEIEQIVISFTYNYETFFVEDGEDLLVATCNNYNYENVDKISEDASYYDTVGQTDYEAKEKFDGSWILKLEYDDEDHEKFPKFIITEQNVELLGSDRDAKLKKGGSIRLIARNDKAFQIVGNKLEEVPLLSDKVKLNKIKIALSLEK